MPVLCPRCNRLGYLVRFRRGNRVYVYVKHVVEEGYRRRYKYCYVGPGEDYEHVQKIHGEMALTNIIDQDYASTISAVVQKQLELAEKLAEQGRKWLAEQQLDRLENALKKALEAVEELKKSFK